MKCSNCEYWVTSRAKRGYCKCTNAVKPCELVRHNKQYKTKRRKKMERYDKKLRKERF